jgi:HSF-type DNA-binding
LGAAWEMLQDSQSSRLCRTNHAKVRICYHVLYVTRIPTLVSLSKTLHSNLCRYFRQSKFTSFQRQLSLYDFHRITHGPDRGIYYHEYFLRGMPRLADQHMVRTKIKSRSTGAVQAAAAAHNRHVYFEPNFYALPPISRYPHTVDDTVGPHSHAVSISSDSDCDASLGETSVASNNVWNEIDPILLLEQTMDDTSLDKSVARSPSSSHDCTDTCNRSGLISNTKPAVVSALEPVELELDQDEVLDFMVQQFLEAP